MWHRRIAPTLGLLDLLVCLVLTPGTFPTLTGGSTGPAVAMGPVLVVVTVVGVVVGRMRAGTRERPVETRCADIPDVKEPIP